MYRDYNNHDHHGDLIIYNYLLLLFLLLLPTIFDVKIACCGILVGEVKLSCRVGSSNILLRLLLLLLFVIGRCSVRHVEFGGRVGANGILLRLLFLLLLLRFSCGFRRSTVVCSLQRGKLGFGRSKLCLR